MPNLRRRSLPWLACLLLPVVACAKGSTTTPEPSPAPEAAATEPAAPVVKNVDAQPGDTTTCPFSGRTFVVKADHPQVEYEGQRYWICSEQAAEQVRADPAKYLQDFDG